MAHTLARQHQLAGVLAYVWKLITVTNIVKCQEHSKLYTGSTVLTAEVLQHYRSICISPSVQNVLPPAFVPVFYFSVCLLVLLGLVGTFRVC